MEKRLLKFSFGNKVRELPYYLFGGKKDGPVGFISGGMHGNEINGVALVSHLMDQRLATGMEDKMNGKLIVVPILNISGFDLMQRRVSEDNVDLNRSFSDNEPSTYAEQLAKHLVSEIFQNCDFGIDAHDAGGRLVLTPHPRFHKCSDSQCDLETRRMAFAFGSPILYEREGKEGMFAVYMNDKHNIPVLTIESGGHQQIKDNQLEFSYFGIMSILSMKGIVGAEHSLSESGDQVVLTTRSTIRSESSGIVRHKKKLGDKVTKGEIISTVKNPLTLETYGYTAHVDGYVLGLRNPHHIITDKPLFSLLGL